MTDKQIVETLKNIKEHCNSKSIVECTSCKFAYLDDIDCKCQLKEIIKELLCYPDSWNIEKIERIINE